MDRCSYPAVHGPQSLDCCHPLSRQARADELTSRKTSATMDYIEAARPRMSGLGRLTPVGAIVLRWSHLHSKRSVWSTFPVLPASWLEPTTLDDGTPKRVQSAHTIYRPALQKDTALGSLITGNFPPDRVLWPALKLRRQVEAISHASTGQEMTPMDGQGYA